MFIHTFIGFVCVSVHITKCVDRFPVFFAMNVFSLFYVCSLSLIVIREPLRRLPADSEKFCVQSTFIIIIFFSQPIHSFFTMFFQVIHVVLLQHAHIIFFRSRDSFLFCSPTHLKCLADVHSYSFILFRSVQQVGRRVYQSATREK